MQYLSASVAVSEKCFSEGIICDSANPRFICRRRRNKWKCAQKVNVLK